MGKLMPRYCNVCGRLVTPREIERGNAIVYGMHCYCAKCKEELMPVIEALRKRLQKQDAQQRLQKQKKAKLQKATRTEFFFDRPVLAKRQEPPSRRLSTGTEPGRTRVVKAEVASQNARNVGLEPVDFAKLKRVGKEVPLPPGAVKIGNKLIEVTPDGIRQQMSPPRDPVMRSSLPQRISHHHRASSSSPAEASRDKSRSASTKRSGLSGTALTVILLFIGIGVGFSYYFLVCRHHSADSSASGSDDGRQSGREQRLAQQIQALKRQVETLSTPSDWLPLRRRIKRLLREARGSQKARLERLLAEGEAWFKRQSGEKAGRQQQGAQSR
ncbi:MAG: hypothetical protein DRP82_00740 [Planctomycetota bacterium]|nr:MAG: hypothetical protein DRP82_00740 [Planctomycetota bacterium]